MHILPESCPNVIKKNLTIYSPTQMLRYIVFIRQINKEHRPLPFNYKLWSSLVWTLYNEMSLPSVMLPRLSCIQCIKQFCHGQFVNSSSLQQSLDDRSCNMNGTAKVLSEVKAFLKLDSIYRNQKYLTGKKTLISASNQLLESRLYKAGREHFFTQSRWQAFGNMHQNKPITSQDTKAHWCKGWTGLV